MAKFDFASEIARTKAKMADKKLSAIILAPSGGGKSSLCGTLGVPTLMLYCSAEQHGPQAAEAYATGAVTAMCIDEDRTPDQALEFLNAVLADTEFLSSFEAIAIDSATKLELVLKETGDFRARCLTDKGKHNTFAESAALTTMFDEIVRKLQTSGKHSIMTLALDVKEMDKETGEIIEAQPRLTAYQVAEGLIMSHGDVFIIGPMTKGEKTMHRIQFNGKISKTSKDLNGNVKRFINFTPRLAGCKTLPESLPPELSEVLKYKKGKK